jgi:hypothetical protein
MKAFSWLAGALTAFGLAYAIGSPASDSGPTWPLALSGVGVVLTLAALLDAMASHRQSDGGRFEAEAQERRHYHYATRRPRPRRRRPEPRGTSDEIWPGFD